MNIAAATPLHIKSCFLIPLSTGLKASSLLDFREKLMVAGPDCIYHHFWASRLYPSSTNIYSHNDFACWAERAGDSILAEKLNIIDPTEFAELEDLKQAVLQVFEKKMDENDGFWLKKEDSFNFLSSLVVVCETGIHISHPTDMARLLEELPLSCIFYHFVDARQRNAEKCDDFSLWLQCWGQQYDQLIKKINGMDVYFNSLSRLKEEFVSIIKNGI